MQHQVWLGPLKDCGSWTWGNEEVCRCKDQEHLTTSRQIGYHGLVFAYSEISFIIYLMYYLSIQKPTENISVMFGWCLSKHITTLVFFKNLVSKQLKTKHQTELYTQITRPNTSVLVFIIFSNFQIDRTMYLFYPGLDIGTHEMTYPLYPDGPDC